MTNQHLIPVSTNNANADTLANLPLSTELLIITSSYSNHAESEVGIIILGPFLGIGATN